MLTSAKTLFGCYRKDEANDPDVYLAAIVAILSEYSQEVVDYVVDPRTGIAGKNTFLPSVAEVKQACELRQIVVKDRENALREMERARSEPKKPSLQKYLDEREFGYINRIFEEIRTGIKIDITDGIEKAFRSQLDFDVLKDRYGDGSNLGHNQKCDIIEMVYRGRPYDWLETLRGHP